MVESTLPPDASAGWFRLRRAICAWLRDAAESAALAIVLDDLHAADAETLALLDTVAEQLAAAPILLVAAYRPTETGDRLAETLAVLARRSPRRLPLCGLSLPEVNTLVRAVYAGPVDAATVAALAERTGGNPFYVKETVGLLAAEGAPVAVSGVPDGVRDVLLRRLARLPAAAVSVLRLAAVCGLEADVEVLVAATEADDRAQALDALEACVVAGLLTEPAPGLVRFAHALVRDTVYTGISGLRRAGMHGQIALALERLRPGDLSALAHHFTQAGSSGTAASAVSYAVRAAELAERRYAHHAASELLARALACQRRIPPDAGSGDREAQRIDLLGRLLRAQVRSGAVAAARATRQRAVELAERAGREDLLLAALTAWTEPAPWQARPYGLVDARTVDGVERLLRRADLDPPARVRLLATLVAELAGEDDPRTAPAARETVELARRLSDPALLAFALAEDARRRRWDREPDRRARLAAEIGRIGTEHGLVAYRWWGEYIAATVAGARGDLAALTRHVEQGLEMARAYQMCEPLAVGLCSEGMLAHVAGRFADAERSYTVACAQMERTGSLHADGFRVLAAVTVRASQHRLADFARLERKLDAEYGREAADVRAAALAAAGRHDEARAVVTAAPMLRPDFYLSIFATLRAMAVVAVGDRESAEELYALLLPVGDQLAGAASTSLAMRPVGHTLGELALLLDRPGAAAEHFTTAVAVARAWQAPHWETEARSARRRCRP